MTLHVYAQEHEHDDAYIVGTREDLVALRDAIDRALAAKAEHCSSDSLMEAFAADGECYDLYIKVVPKSVQYQLLRPYAELREEPDQGFRHPCLVPTE
ncbi:hypothetical protein [Burkholderia sp. MBR-1]|uniref:hypothetical protein n=1 Tax=Burkholderia sp. MBR-1 TaxID=2732364 RepID=UPI0015EF12FC|nr:hypothetical protein [Burkholderia sp. MBR-1]QMI49728.1 hypothetical protein MBR110_30095 [Burkholderia sp. MBR-1]